MRAVVIADDDSRVVGAPSTPVGLLISLGDLWDATIEKARAFYHPVEVVAVRGNHDSAAPFAEGITDLHLRVWEHQGIRFGGFGGSWKYKPRGHHLYEQSEVSAALREFPPVDVFVAHNSPRGIHERDGDVHQGFDGFIDYLDRVSPRYFLHGNQHLSRTR